VSTASGHGARRKEKTARRRLWVALLFSLITPGLGQLYNGLPGRAFVAVALVLASQAIILAASTLPPETISVGYFHMGLLGLYLLLWLAILLDATIGAWRVGDIPLRKFNHPAVYLVVLVGWFAEYQVFDRIESAVSASITYPAIAGSMEPTLERGDLVFGHKGFYGENDVSRGDVVSFRKPGNEDEIYLLRVIGLPGDRVRIEGGLLMLNGEAVARHAADRESGPEGGARLAFSIFGETLPGGVSYRISEQLDAAGFADNTPDREVPPGTVFLLGDSRDKATDSRIFGPVPIEKLESRLTLIFWSRDDARMGMGVQPGG
jgi:signal peptidase I